MMGEVDPALRTKSEAKDRARVAIRSAISVIVLLMLSIAGAQRSFGLECTKARTRVGQDICGDAGLRAVDAQVYKIYSRTLGSLRGSDRALLIEEQRRWLDSREELCEWPDENRRSCLLGLMRIRTRALSLGKQRAKAAILNEYLMLVSEKPDWQSGPDCVGRSEFEVLDCAAIRRARARLTMEHLYLRLQHALRIDSKAGKAEKARMARWGRSLANACQRRVRAYDVIGRTADAVAVNCYAEKYNLKAAQLRERLAHAAED
jgi:uncharacterized protein YecT (DUF1311 family)